MRMILRCSEVAAHTSFVRAFYERYSPEYLCGIFPSQECAKAQNVPFSDVFCDPYIFMEAIYTSSALEVKPVDQPLMDAFAPYMAETLLMAERLNHKYFTLASYYDLQDYVSRQISFWNTFIDVKKIDLFASSYVPHLCYDFIIYALCKIKGIPTVFSCISPKKGYYYIQQDVRVHCPSVAGVFSDLMQTHADDNVEDIPLSQAFKELYDAHTMQGEDTTPHYMKEALLALEREKKKPLERKPNDNLSAVAHRAKTVAGNGGISRMFGNFVRRVRKDGFGRTAKNLYEINRRSIVLQKQAVAAENAVAEYKRYWDSKVVLPNYNSKYIYYPLHKQPECTTLPLAGVYVQQKLAIQQLASFLPKDVYIYIKEHPLQTNDARGKRFCDELAAIKQVRLMPRGEDTAKLARNAMAVASCTGTVLTEGFFKGIPGIAFGYTIMENAPGITSVKSAKQCEKAVKQLLEGTWHCPSEKERKLFLLALQNVCFPSYLNGSISLHPDPDAHTPATIDAFDGVISEFFDDEGHRKP